MICSNQYFRYLLHGHSCLSSTWFTCLWLTYCVCAAEIQRKTTFLSEPAFSSSEPSLAILERYKCSPMITVHTGRVKTSLQQADPQCESNMLSKQGIINERYSHCLGIQFFLENKQPYLNSSRLFYVLASSTWLLNFTSVLPCRHVCTAAGASYCPGFCPVLLQ